jgi:uncharacterized damage-inducible protein DinB
MTAPMITPDYCRTMGRYNLWQNRSLVACADALSADERARDRGAFWGSIAGTLSHLLWGDSVWMSRFEGSPRPPGTIAASPGFAADWADYRARRSAMDVHILAWADGLAAADLAGDLVWFSGVLKREVSMPKALQVVHFFNHQTHHRGQVHAMLTAAGRRPEDTDLIFMPTML